MKQKFRKKPVVIEAIQWDGKNFKEILDFVGGIEHRDLLAFHQNDLHIKTLEGEHKANINDWIIKGVKGEFYPCKPDIFEETYEEAR